MPLHPLVDANGKCVGVVQYIWDSIPGDLALFRLTTGPTYVRFDGPCRRNEKIPVEQTRALSAVEAVEWLSRLGQTPTSMMLEDIAALEAEMKSALLDGGYVESLGQFARDAMTIARHQTATIEADGRATSTDVISEPTAPTWERQERGTRSINDTAGREAQADVTPDEVRQCFELANRIAKAVWELRQVVVYRAKAPPNVSHDVTAVRDELVALRGTYQHVCRTVPAYFPHLGHIKVDNMLAVVLRLLEETATAINDAANYPPIADVGQRPANFAKRISRLPDYDLADLIHVLDGEMTLTVLLVQWPREKAEALLSDTKERLRRAYERRFPPQGRAPALTEAAPAAPTAARAGASAQAADDESAYVLASTIWRGRWTTYKRFKKWLLKNPQVRNRQNGRRRYVHSGDFHRAIAEQGRKAFEALDAPAEAVDAFIQESQERQAQLRQQKAAAKAAGQ